MQVRWKFSGLMLAVYVSLFWLWMMFPSRTMFLLTGTLAVAGLSWSMLRAYRDVYFVNRVDVRLHTLVILDLVFETLSFEFFRAFQSLAVVETFHGNTNFVGCALAFTVLIGGYRGYRYLIARRKAVAAT